MSYGTLLAGLGGVTRGALSLSAGIFDEIQTPSLVYGTVDAAE